MDAQTLDNIRIEMGGPWENLLAAMLALMMFAVALGLRPSHFAFFKTDPKHYFAGVLTQIIGLPLLTLGLVWVLHPLPSLALGMIVVACCPGGNVSNLLTLFGRGNTALSVSMTATSSLAAAFLTPISVLFWLSLYPPTAHLLQSIHLDAVRFLEQSLLILVLPILSGMALAYKFPKRAKRLQKPLALIGGLSMLAIVLFGFWKYRDLIPQLALLVIPLVVIHNALAFALGYLVGRLTKADIPTRRAMTFEIGIQNSGLGFVILVTQLAGLGGAAVLVGMWGLWHMIGGGFVALLFRLADVKNEKQKNRRAYVGD